MNRVRVVDEHPSELAEALRRFLFAAFEGAFEEEDFDHGVAGRSFLLEDAAGIVAHGSVVPRPLRCGPRVLRAGYVEAVATRLDQRRRGHGRAIMRAIAAFIGETYELGALSSAARGFYEPLGWELWRGPTGAAPTPTPELAMGSQPTPDDDGGIFILRTPTTPPIDLDGPIVCGWREGDVW